MADWFRTNDGDYLNLDNAKKVIPVEFLMRVFFEWNDETGFTQDYDVMEPDATRLRRRLDGRSSSFDGVPRRAAGVLPEEEAR